MGAENAEQSLAGYGLALLAGHLRASAVEYVGYMYLEVCLASGDAAVEQSGSIVRALEIANN
jgi:hypothetical protein